MLGIGDVAPDFEAARDGGDTIKLSDLRGRKVVLYFYPKDFTPGCTLEARSFRSAQADFEARNAVIIGVSGDNVKSHDRFKASCGLTFPLLCDPDRSIAKAYGVWRKKKMYGRTFLGAVRATYVVDEEGRVEAVYDKVRVRNHVAEVLEGLGRDAPAD